MHACIGHMMYDTNTHIAMHIYIYQRNSAVELTSVGLASFPGSCAGEGEREPGTHCSHMRQVPNLHTTPLH